MSRNVIHYMSQSSSRLGTDLHPTVLCTPHPCLTSHISIYRNVSICTASLSTIGPKQPPPPQQAFLDPGLKVCFLSPFSRIQLFLTLWTIACQAPLSMGFSRQEYWSGLPCPPPGIFPIRGSDTGLAYCRQILDHLSYQRSPRYWSGACPFSRGSSQPRN